MKMPEFDEKRVLILRRETRHFGSDYVVERHLIRIDGNMWSKVVGGPAAVPEENRKWHMIPWATVENEDCGFPQKTEYPIYGEPRDVDIPEGMCLVSCPFYELFDGSLKRHELEWDHVDSDGAEALKEGAL